MLNDTVHDYRRTYHAEHIEMKQLTEKNHQGITTKKSLSQPGNTGIVTMRDIFGVQVIFGAYRQIEETVISTRDQSCTWGMIHTKVHIINPSCPRPSIAIHCRIMA